MPHSLSSAHLTVNGLSKSFGARRVLTDISFTVSAGERVALIGENGTGKSTLLGILAGLLAPDAGTATATVPGKTSARIGLLHQDPPFSPHDTIADALRSAVAPVRAALQKLDDAAVALGETPNTAETPSAAEATARYAEALETVELLDAWNIDTRIEIVLSGLGIASIPRDRRTGDMSGGQRARLSLAWLLLNQPDVLLLDEPTNHLDDSAVEALTRMLSEWRGPVLCASHDRALLDEIATVLINLDPAPSAHARTKDLLQDGTGSGIGVTRFSGSYSDYLEAHRDERNRWEQQYRDEQATISKLRAAVSDSHVVGHVHWKPRTEGKMAQKFYADRNAKVVSRRVNDGRSRLEKLESEQLRKPPLELTFQGIRMPATRSAASGGEPLLVATDLSLATRLDATTFTLDSRGKLLVTGENGSGKSTLLSIVAGRLSETDGSLHIRPGARIGLLEQESTFRDPRGAGDERTVLETFVDCVGTALASECPLSTFGLIAPRDEQQPLSALSVGQRRRLALAVVLADPPDLLLLDEPTNHLSLALAEALETAVLEFPGAVIVASHDRWLRRRWTGETLALKGLKA